jgi:hypothetical protein
MPLPFATSDPISVEAMVNSLEVKLCEVVKMQGNLGDIILHIARTMKENGNLSKQSLAL